MPSDCRSSSFSDYVDTLGELEGLCDSQQFDACIICGDFNVDFERTGRLVNLLDSFMSSSGLVARDLAFRDTITLLMNGMMAVFGLGLVFSVILGEKPKLVISLQFVGLSDINISLFVRS